MLDLKNKSYIQPELSVEEYKMCKVMMFRAKTLSTPLRYACTYCDKFHQSALYSFYCGVI